MPTLGQILVSSTFAALLVAGCGGGGSDSTGARGKVRVVAAENFWGSIAQQLGGNRVRVTSIINSPATDPHDYEPKSADARTMAGSQLAIVNGIGYDLWAPKLIAANPASGRIVLTVGDLLGLERGDNPHQWYSPGSVQRVIDQITADYKQLDPKGSAYFDRRRTTVETRNLARYKQLIAQIKGRYAGVPVGASESIFSPMAEALGLRLLTPPGFLKAISEGTDPTASDKSTTDSQISAREIKVWAYNSQNATPDIQRLNSAAKGAQIPVATVTETMTPAGASFEAWQVRELEGLRAALGKATGR
jgi:zinc/manganese transport system substrate-binding protein